jgi:hypothetical protein
LLGSLFAAVASTVGVPALAGAVAVVPHHGPLAAVASSGPLKITAPIDLGAFSEVQVGELSTASTPTGAFYFASGSVVREVRGEAAPVVVVRPAHPVLALAATSSNLYVQSGRTVSDYGASSGTLRRSWTLRDENFTPTQAGLLQVGNVIWSWTDGATDESGFEYATIEELAADSGSIRVIDPSAYPVDMAADATGLYYESQVGAHSYLVHVATDGAKKTSRATGDEDSPMALVAGSVLLSAQHDSGEPFLDRFAEATLLEQGSNRLGDLAGMLVASGKDLLAIATSCTPATCSSTGVERLDPVTGQVTSYVAVPGIESLLGGAEPLAVSYRSGHAYLTRLS